jgi:hypothetical protein
VGHPRPTTTDLTGDESVYSPRYNQETLLATQRGTDAARRIETDSNGNLLASDPKTTGTWAYHAGASGTLTLGGSERVIGIGAHATAAATVTINGGDSIPVPAGISVSINPTGNLVGAVIVFSGTDSYFVETVV